ncbi:ubiquitin-activating E1 FCCH domain-containing protein [Sphingomonas sp. DG1-23]|uniref:ubiquitin-activating E1 FCCH domain-containing protein n=1 Tax=Sphingomonas sp. DG1-23 TaxID=3068316 RepID=UPI00273DED7E|nr:ubiquitin-activating E1 FCCH domain-containing protein [Sphingomonas sp. DG1-23]MDP5279910.1 ubiquitin-activating E1 FCCH domain-containing protein [Sphingomonas sp. DG1-23]
MTGPRAGQFNFSKGVLSKELWGRHDIAPYSAGVREGKNVLILKYGGLTKRPGTRMVYEVKDGAKRLLPFEGAYEASYALVMGQGNMRLAALGGMVLEEALTVEGATQTNPVLITASFHGYADGDEVFFRDVEGMTELNGRVLTVTVIDEDQFSVNVDGTGFSAFAGDDGGIIRVEEPDPEPTPPVVPPPVDPPEDPPVGGGGYCVTSDTMILMADGVEKSARRLVVGDMVRTRHATTLEWGDFPVTAVQRVVRAVWRAEIGDQVLRASKGHRFWNGEEWVKIETVGERDGVAEVVAISVGTARSYISNGILSHNIKAREPISYL